MMQSSNRGESERDDRLRLWLREAADCELEGIEGHLDEVRRALIERLGAAELNAARSRQPVGVCNSMLRNLTELVARHRLAAGGIGATLVLVVAVLLVALNSGERLSATERMAKKLQEVRSYSYKLSTLNTFVKDGKTEPTTVTRKGTAYWCAPGSLSSEETIMYVEKRTPSGEENRELVAQYSEIFPASKPGIFIDHMAKTYVCVPVLRWEDIPKYSPVNQLKMVREGSGEVLRDLGTKQVQGKSARGYVLALKNAEPGSGLDAVEVWIDPETDLPLEFGYTIKNDKGPEFFRVTDCHWNMEIDPRVFATTPPKGYDDITPPTDEKDLAQVAAALRLYSQLSGGHYPQGKTFNAGEILEDMKKMAGFTGPAQPEWARDKKYLDIQQAAAGLHWIERILRNRFVSGYRGMRVGPADKDQVLLWWTTANDRYHVFYGDLRSRVLSEAEWAKLVPAAERSGNRNDE